MTTSIKINPKIYKMTKKCSFINSIKKISDLDLEKYFKINNKKIKNEKLLFELLKKLYININNNYLSCMILNFIKNELNNIDENKFLSWLIDREKNAKERLYMLPYMTLLSNNKILDIRKKEASNFNEKYISKIKIKGGIIIDKTNYHWINYMISMTNNNNNNNNNNNLIICSEFMLDVWIKKINKENKKNIISIFNKKTHETVTCNKILSSEYTLIDYKYILKIVSKYEKENILLETLNEFLNINWNRVILDSNTTNELYKNPAMLKLILLIKSNKKWIQMDKIVEYNKNNMLISLLTGENTVSYPLYDKMGIYNIKNILYNLHPFIEKRKYQIERKKILVGMSNIEKKILKALGEKYLNTKMDEIFLKCSKMNDIINNDKCSICMEKIKTKTICECKHIFCLTCILKNLQYSKSCPLCRGNIIMNKIKINSRLKNEYSNKIKKTIELVKKLEGKTLVLVKSNNTIKTMKKISLIKKNKIITCSGTNEQKRNIVKKFNEDKIKGIIIKTNDNELIKNITNITNIIVYDAWNHSNTKSSKTNHNVVKTSVFEEKIKNEETVLDYLDNERKKIYIYDLNYEIL